MAFALKCPECRRSFKWDPNKCWPEQCPLCKAMMEELSPDNVIAIPAFLSAKTRSVDKVYRDTEAASIHRMEQAAAVAGCDVSEMSALKVTNMRDNLREGDIAHVPVVNDVTRAMDAINARGGKFGWQGATGVEYSGAVQSGPFPNAGAKMRTAIHNANGAISDRPALETQKPDYRIRG